MNRDKRKIKNKEFTLTPMSVGGKSCAKSIKQNSMVGGFTLIEMIVSTAIFILVLSASVGALLTMVSANDKSQALRVAMDNMNFVMEEMSRHVTQGHTYYCGNTPSLPGHALGELDSLTAQSCVGGSDLYFLSNKDGIGRIYYGLNSDEIVKSEWDADVGAQIINNDELTNRDILTITNLDFFVEASEGVGDTKQPKILISISGEVTVGKEDTKFNVQTTVVQRVPQID